MAQLLASMSGVVYLQHLSAQLINYIYIYIPVKRRYFDFLMR